MEELRGETVSLHLSITSQPWKNSEERQFHFISPSRVSHGRTQRIVQFYFISPSRVSHGRTQRRDNFTSSLHHESAMEELRGEYSFTSSLHHESAMEELRGEYSFTSSLHESAMKELRGEYSFTSSLHESAMEELRGETVSLHLSITSQPWKNSEERQFHFISPSRVSHGRTDYNSEMIHAHTHIPDVRKIEELLFLPALEQV